MSNLIFERTLPEGYTINFEPWLFQHVDHRRIQSATGWVDYALIDAERKQIEAILSLCVDEGVGFSPCRAPFGSVQCSDRLRPGQVYTFLSSVSDDCQKKGLREIVFKNPPDAYQPYWAPIINTCLINQGFHPMAEIGAYLSTNELFDDRLSAWERRRLNQSRSAGLSFQRVPLDRLVHIFSFIGVCREERKQALTITLETLDRTVSTFPDRVHLFSVSSEEEICAAAICIDVGRGVLYNFMSAHPHAFDHLSPVVQLLEGVHQFCATNGFHMLDLGTSTLNGQPNFGLLDFKLGLGAYTTSKFTFSKILG